MTNPKRIVIYAISAAGLAALALSFSSLKEYKEYKRAKDAGTTYALESYLYQHPDSKYAAEAKDLLEERDFEGISQSIEPSVCDKYIISYPKGKHIEEVYFRKAELQKDDAAGRFSTVNAYLHAFPAGKYASQMNTMCDEMWDKAIANYQKRDKTNESPRAVKYITEMLQYMKLKRINTIRVKVNPHLDIKDYDDYSKDVRYAMEKGYTWELAFPQNLEQLKRNFSQRNMDDLNSILEQGVKNSMDRIIMPGFINAAADSVADKDAPVFEIDYIIKSQEMKYGAANGPVIWIWSESSTYGIGKRVKGYLQGVVVKFNAVCTLPGSDNTYDYSEEGAPGESIKHISSMKDAYKTMTSTCFRNFSDKMARNMGLENLNKNQ